MAGTDHKGRKPGRPGPHRNDESEISEVVRRRLFENLGSPRTHQRVAKAYAEWCFERSNRLPAEWTTVDTATNEARAKESLQRRFEACYPFHPATLSVFQRKWSALPQFQKTRGALAMLAQWISSASSEQFKQARNEPLITLGSAPLHVPSFRETVLAQLGERRLTTAIDADLAGQSARAKPVGRRHQGGAQGHSQASRYRHALRIFRRDGRQGRPPP